jgi:hypothetical protein
MVFTYFFLHPAISSLDMLQRVKLMHIAPMTFFSGFVLVAASLTLRRWSVDDCAGRQTNGSVGRAIHMPLDWTRVMAVLGGV